MVTQKTDEVAEQEEVLEFARYGGPGTIMYPSPRPTDVRDLSLPAMRWVQVDPAYRFSGVFARDKKNKVFETVKSGASPDDRQFKATQVALARRLTLITGGPGTGKTYALTRILTSHEPVYAFMLSCLVHIHNMAGRLA